MDIEWLRAKIREEDYQVSSHASEVLSFSHTDMKLVGGIF